MGNSVYDQMDPRQKWLGGRAWCGKAAMSRQVGSRKSQERQAYPAVVCPQYHTISINALPPATTAGCKLINRLIHWWVIALSRSRHLSNASAINTRLLGMWNIDFCYYLHFQTSTSNMSHSFLKIYPLSKEKCCSYRCIFIISI